MKLKIALATATAMGLLMSGAWADDNNRATVEQDGNQNSASVDQSDGSGNFVGTPNSTSVFGHVEQTGDNNLIDIEQDGFNNLVARPYGNSNLFQDGDRNSVEIYQNNAVANTGNTVGRIDQDSSAGATSWTNRLVILQDSSSATGQRSRNTVGTVTQNNDSAGTSDAQSNVIDIRQVGDGGYTEGNFVYDVTQDGSGNLQDVDQDGLSNYIGTTSQSGSSNSATVGMTGNDNALHSLTQDNAASGAGGNLAAINLEGNNNGTGEANSIFQNGSSPFTRYPQSLATFSAASAAEGVGTTQAVVDQQGGDNSLNYDAVGNNNLYGFRQAGNSNIIGGTVSGDSHELAILQDGDGNVADVLQTGTGNDAGISIDGDDNHLNVRQDQLGASGNTMSVSITGSDNNNYPVSPALSGAADAVRDGLTTALIQGDLFQEGSNNALTVTVSTSSNAFAALQDGDNNVATHIISGGNGNQAVIAQVGNGNVSDTSQMGANNNIGISQ